VGCGGWALSALGAQGLRLRTGHLDLDMLAPPLDEFTPHGRAWVEQRKAGDMLTIEGLVSHFPGASCILNPPLPVLSVKIEGREKAGNTSNNLLGKFKAHAHQLEARPHHPAAPPPRRPAAPPPRRPAAPPPRRPARCGAVRGTGRA
jgi:hypothetical protein